MRVYILTCFALLSLTASARLDWPNRTPIGEPCAKDFSCPEGLFCNEDAICVEESELQPYEFDDEGDDEVPVRNN